MTVDGNPATLTRIRVKLSVVLLATFYNQGLNDSQIADRCNCTRQSVSEYKMRHIEEIRPLVVDPDLYASIDAAYLAQQARSRLNNILESPDKPFVKRDIIPLVAVTDQLTKQSRLHAGKSTQNVSQATNDSNMDECNKAIEASEARLKAMMGKIENVKEADYTVED